jgi:hypothetical protein
MTEAIAQANAVLVSMLGVLALLLAFTFSAALQRYDARSKAAVAESNAIGTTYLRAQRFPREMHDEVRSLLRRYSEIRIEKDRVDFADAERGSCCTRQNGCKHSSGRMLCAQRNGMGGPSPAASSSNCSTNSPMHPPQGGRPTIAMFRKPQYSRCLQGS